MTEVRRRYKVLALFLTVSLGLLAQSLSPAFASEGNIDSTNKYAWGENAGWINFHPTHSQVTINTSTGEFDGYAWSENLGWIHFKNVSPAYKVQTSWPTVTWNGSSSTDWGTAANCDSNAVPASTENVVIPDATTTPSDPTVSSGAVCDNITIEASGILNGSSNTLTVSGNWDNNGTFTAGSSTVTLDGAADQNLTSGSQAFYNLTLNNSGTTPNNDITLQDALDVDNNLTLTNGDLN